MKVVTPEQMRKLDKIAMEQYGIPGVVLMENAGRRIAKEAVKLSGGGGKPMVLIAGKGNNGGDVMVAARHLFNRGCPVKVFALKELTHMKGDAGLNAAILIKMDIPVHVISSAADLASFHQALEGNPIVIDGMFGTGFRGGLTDTILSIVRAVNKSRCSVISVDIPSGVDGETGQIRSGCVMADVTVTFGFPKTGLLQYPGAKAVGHLIVADISIPRNIETGPGPGIVLLTEELVSKIIPRREPDAHKGSCGKVAIIGGSEGMSGAVVLCTLGSLKSGAGLVKAGLPGMVNYVLENCVTEAISVPLGKGACLGLQEGAKDRLTEMLSWADAVAVGPGMGVKDSSMEFLEYLLTKAETPLVLDADALNCISHNIELLGKVTAPVIITPHPGEMSRLTGMETKEIQYDRLNVAKTFAEKWGVIIVLKGANSVIAHPSGDIYINTSGNPGMASGGMGDVLTGIIASFMAQGAAPVEAACAAVYTHGRAGDALAGERGTQGIMATDLADYIPGAIRDIKNYSGDKG